MGICVKPGKCDLTSNLCAPHSLGKPTAKIGDPCKDDTECAGNMVCLGTDGNYYAVGVMEHLGLAEEGLTRIGFVQYSTEAEVDRVLDALASLA